MRINRLKSSYVILIIFLLSGGNTQATLNEEAITLKNSFSNIVLHDLNGQPQNINKFAEKNKWLVVMFWASTCHISDASIKQYVDFHETHKDDDAIVLGVSVDGSAQIEQAKMFVKNHNVGFNNVIVDYADISALFSDMSGEEWEGTPSFLIISPQGEVMAQQAGAVPADFIASYIKKTSEQIR